MTFSDAAGVHAGAAQADDGAVSGGGGEHAVEVVVAVGELLAGDGAADGIAEAEDADFDLVAFGEVAGESQPVVGALVAVGGALEDDQDVHDTADVSIGSWARCHSGKPSSSRRAARRRRRRSRTASSANTQYGPRQ